MSIEMKKVKLADKDIRNIVKEIYDSIHEGSGYRIVLSQDADTHMYDVILKSEDHYVILYKDIMELAVAEQYIKSIYLFLNE